MNRRANGVGPLIRGWWQKFPSSSRMLYSFVCKNTSKNSSFCDYDSYMYITKMRRKSNKNLSFSEDKGMGLIGKEKGKILP